MDILKTVLGLLGMFLPPSPSVTELVPGGDPALMARVEKALKEHTMWQWKISGAVCVLILSTTCIFFFARFARAADVEEIAASQRMLTMAVNAQLASTTADSICRLVSKRAIETNPYEREQLRKDIDELQSKYRQYTGLTEDYPERRCGP